MKTFAEQLATFLLYGKYSKCYGPTRLQCSPYDYCLYAEYGLWWNIAVEELHSGERLTIERYIRL